MKSVTLFVDISVKEKEREKQPFVWLDDVKEGKEQASKQARKGGIMIQLFFSRYNRQLTVANSFEGFFPQLAYSYRSGDDISQAILGR